MLKKILSYGFIEAIAKGLNKLILLLLPFFLLSDDFGKIGLIISIETLLPLVTLLGFERVILRFYAKKNEYVNFDKTLTRSILFTHIGVLAILSLLALFGIHSFLGLNIVFDWILLVFLVYFQGINQFTLNKFRVLEQHQNYFKARLFLNIGKFLLILGIVFLTKDYKAYLIGGIFVAICTNLLFKVKSSSREEKFNQRTFQQFFLFSWPFIFHGISMNLLGNADKFIIEKYLNLTEVGLYTFAYSIGSMLVFAYMGVSVYMEPVIYKAKTTTEKENFLAKFNVIALASGVIMYVFISIISIYVLPNLYNKTYISVIHFVPSISLAHLLFPYYLSANYRMIYDKKTMRIAITSIIACLFNIGLNFYLIPIYGLYAAVLVTLISYFIQAIGFVWVSNQFKLSTELLEILLLGVLIFLGIYFKINFLVIALVIGSLVFIIYRLKNKKG